MLPPWLPLVVTGQSREPVSCLQERSRLEGALERARVGLEERNFLIVAHERSESSLAAHALDLTCRLNAALADHASLTRRCSLV